MRFLFSKTSPMPRRGNSSKSCADRNRFRIERITSSGQSSPHELWYNQAWDEWVLVFRAGQSSAFKIQKRQFLAAGDWLMITAHRKYRPTLDRILADSHSEWH
jgi:hypothetical protein